MYFKHSDSNCACFQILRRSEPKRKCEFRGRRFRKAQPVFKTALCKHRDARPHNVCCDSVFVLQTDEGNYAVELKLLMNSFRMLFKLTLINTSVHPSPERKCSSTECITDEITPHTGSGRLFKANLWRTLEHS